MPKSGSVQTFLWDINKQEIGEEALQTVDAIIHLTGAGIAEKHWTKERKIEIVKSRTDSTQLLFNELKKGTNRVKTFVSASGIDYYGLDESDTIFTENEKQGKGFLAEVVRQWEEAADQISTLGIRVVKLRTGVVLSEKGGALKELMRPVKFYVGAPLGSGMQYLSWIHIDDLCNIYIKAIEDETMKGVYNAVASHPVTNKDFTHILAKVLHKPVILPPVPAFLLKVLLGEMADLVLKGNKVSSQKIQATGFQFKFDKIKDALKDLLVNR
jgi:hypothetical protein